MKIETRNQLLHLAVKKQPSMHGGDGFATDDERKWHRMGNTAVWKNEQMVRIRRRYLDFRSECMHGEICHLLFGRIQKLKPRQRDVIRVQTNPHTYTADYTQLRLLCELLGHVVRFLRAYILLCEVLFCFFFVWFFSFCFFFFFFAPSAS